MAENQTAQRTEFSQMGHREAARRLFEGTGYVNSSKVKVKEGIICSKMMMQGVDFDLVYHPLKHLGYKAALNVVGEIYAAFYRPDALCVSLGISSHFCYEDIAELWSGVVAAAKEHSVQTLHLDLFPSLNGLQISLSLTGSRAAEIDGKIKSPASMDLICLSGNVGAAYMGQHVLEREKSVFLAAGEANAKQPDLSKYKYLLSQYLCPEIAADTVENFTKGGFYPTAGVFDSRGLSEAINTLCSQTGLGAKIYLDRLPIASETFEMANEIHIDAVTAAASGGEDYRLIYTLPIEQFESFHKEVQNFDVIGHLCRQDVGAVMVTPDGAELPIKEM